jgi:hypothetical protein
MRLDTGDRAKPPQRGMDKDRAAIDKADTPKRVADRRWTRESHCSRERVVRTIVVNETAGV